MEPQCPSWQGLHAAASRSLPAPLRAQRHAPGAALLERKAEPVPRMLPCTLQLDLPLFQTPCAGSAPKGWCGGAGQAGAASPRAQQPAGAPEGGLGIGRALAEAAAVEVAASLGLRRVRSVCLGFLWAGTQPRGLLTRMTLSP